MTQQNEQFPAEVLAPIGLDEFFDQYWETEPLHIHRAASEHFAKLITVSDIETLLSTSELSFPSIQLTQSDNPVPVSEYADTDNRILLSRLMQCHRQGATMVLSQAQNYFPALRELTRQVQTGLQLRSQANVYLSPPGRQGFHPHYDSHDVFILQVSGKKTFRFYRGGVDLPFSENSFDSEQSEVGPLMEEIQLQGGDTLYIPRGVVHDAQADGSESSLHITLGVYAVTVRNVIQQLVQIESEKNLAFRKSLDHRLWRQRQQPGNSSADQIENLLAQVFSEENLELALSRLRDHLALDTHENCSGLLSTAGDQQAVQLQSVFSVQEDLVIGAQVTDQKLSLRVHGRILHFEEEMIEAVKWLLAAKSAKVEELKNLDSDQKIALATRLLQENVVKITGP